MYRAYGDTSTTVARPKTLRTSWSMLRRRASIFHRQCTWESNRGTSRPGGAAASRQSRARRATVARSLLDLSWLPTCIVRMILSDRQTDDLLCSSRIVQGRDQLERGAGV